MKRKTLSISAVWISLLLVGTLSLTFNIQPANSDWTWTETIYIRADGSVEPDTAPISTYDNITYTLTDNIVGNVPYDSSAIIIERNNIVVDGAGYTIEGTEVEESKGIYILGLANVTIKNINIKHFGYGIYLDGSSNNVISGNNITANNWYGIWIKSSSNNNVSGNTITANNYAGIRFYSSSYNNISGNHMTSNWDGIVLWGSSYNRVVGNNITANINHGILLYISSNNNSVFGNNMTANKDGIFLGYSPNYNSIYHNNFVDNARQVYDFSWEGFGEPSINVWDHGYPSGGNYWSDYAGQDLSGDGIGDTPYVIDENNQDNYPLMNPWTPAPPEFTGTVYIRADGSVEPDTAPISTFDNITYTLTDNIIADVPESSCAIVIERDNMVFDGAGYTISGPAKLDTKGVYIGFRSNVTVRNVEVTNFETGILIAYSNNNKLTDSNSSSNKQNAYGIRLYDSCNNYISGNIAHLNNHGIWLDAFSNNNTVTGNNFSSNKGNGMYIYQSSNNTISGNTVSSNDLSGIYVGSSSNNTLIRNIFNSNQEEGIRFYWSTNNVLVGNDASNNKFNGIELMNSYNNTIKENNCSSNRGGPNLTGGIGIAFYESSNNTVSGNNIAKNQVGIVIQEANNNVLFHNNVIDNSYQTYAVYPGGTNAWDNGYPSGGNYWSDYTGTDYFSGPYQDETGSDGIGDTQYTTNYPNVDRYPLMKPWFEHELKVSVMAPTSMRLGRSSLLNATVQNLGRNNEINVELILLINETMIDSTTIPLLQREDSYTINHLWTPTGAGIYNVTSYVPSLPEEINKINNRAETFVAVNVYTPQPPVASFTHSPTAPVAGNTVNFDASTSYDSDGSILSYNWEFGDGATGSGKIVTHAYASAGAYTVTLTVTDDEDITDTETSTITILIAPKVGVKAGDWIKCTYTISGWPTGTPYPQWLKLEFTSVEGTTATVRVTMRMSNGTELSETVPVDIASGGQALGLSGFIIPANSTTGDSINFGGFGFIVSTATIEGETTRTYAGASRTVVYASISQYGTQLTYYWDKQTGVMVEASTTSGSVAATGKATETNMWQAQPQQEAFPIWIIGVAVAAIVLAAATILFLKKRKQPTKNTTDSLSSA